MQGAGSDELEIQCITGDAWVCWNTEINVLQQTLASYVSMSLHWTMVAGCFELKIIKWALVQSTLPSFFSAEDADTCDAQALLISTPPPRTLPLGACVKMPLISIKSSIFLTLPKAILWSTSWRNSWTNQLRDQVFRSLFYTFWHGRFQGIVKIKEVRNTFNL